MQMGNLLITWCNVKVLMDLLQSEKSLWNQKFYLVRQVKQICATSEKVIFRKEGIISFSHFGNFCNNLCMSLKSRFLKCVTLWINVRYVYGKIWLTWITVNFFHPGINHRRFRSWTVRALSIGSRQYGSGGRRWTVRWWSVIVCLVM